MTAKNREELKRQLKVGRFVLNQIARFYNDDWRRVGMTEDLGDHYEITMKHPRKSANIIIQYDKSMTFATVLHGYKIIDAYKP